MLPYQVREIIELSEKLLIQNPALTPQACLHRAVEFYEVSEVWRKQTLAALEAGKEAPPPPSPMVLVARAGTYLVRCEFTIYASSPQGAAEKADALLEDAAHRRYDVYEIDRNGDVGSLVATISGAAGQ